GADNVSAEENLIRKLNENLENLKKSELIIFYTNTSRGVQSFLQFWQGLSAENQFSLKDKRFIQISDERLNQIGKRTSPLRESLGIKEMLLTRKDALSVLINKIETKDITADLDSFGIEYKILDAKFQSTLWPLTRLMNFFVTNGISQTVVYLLLAVPFLTFMVSFFRQFVGISTFGVFAPLMLSLSFMVMGIQFGIMVFAVVMAVSYMIRSVFEKVDILYIPKVSLLLSFLALSFFFVLALAIALGLKQNLALTVFPMMVMSTISEKFLASQSSEGLKTAIINTAETVFVSLVAYAFVEWDVINNAVTARPEWILLPILGNIWLGRFTGLRMTEYFKFRSLLREDSQEE
ncbi:MAG TPA: 7TM domain-containing protein, partial [Candidatus Gracilibacteria bacterium]